MPDLTLYSTTNSHAQPQGDPGSAVITMDPIAVSLPHISSGPCSPPSLLCYGWVELRTTLCFIVSCPVVLHCGMKTPCPGPSKVSTMRRPQALLGPQERPVSPMPLFPGSLYLALTLTPLLLTYHWSTPCLKLAHSADLPKCPLPSILQHRHL